MKKTIVALVGALFAVGPLVAGSLSVTRVAWDAAAARTAFTVEAEASLKARTVYLVWGQTDKGANWLDWDRGEIIGTLPAGETTATFLSSLASRYAPIYRLFTFDATETGDGYLAYVTSTGKQYINTGLYPTYQSAAWADYNWNDTTGQSRVFGNNNNAFTFAHYISGKAATGGMLAYGCKDDVGNWKNYSNVVNTNRAAVTVDSYVNDYYGRFRIEREGVAICNRAIADSSAITSRTQTATFPLYVFTHCNNKKGEAANFGKLNLYRFRYWNAGVAQLDYRPYVKDGVAGVWDAVKGAFVKSTSSTAFVAGPRLGTTTLDASEAVAAPWRDGLIVNQCATFENLTGGPDSPLARVESISVNDATFKYVGKEGEKGLYDGDVTLSSGTVLASTFDITGDLTLSGKFENTSGNGSFVKTGPGTLRIPGTSGTEYLIKSRSPIESENSLGVLTAKADGTSPEQGYQPFTLAEGRLVLGENGGKFRFLCSNGTDFQIGRMTVDPADPQGRQEVEAVLEIAGGTTVISNWVNVGGKNGFVTTTPNKVPESGIRVTGGTLHCMASITFGRNKVITPQKDASGNWIRQRCCPFIEVLGGKLQMWKTNRIGFCDDPGADLRVLVDTGTLYVSNKDASTGDEILIGCCSEGDKTAPRTCNITVQNGGTFDCTGFRIAKSDSIINITNNVRIVDGGIFRVNSFYKCSTQASCEHNLLFDGGIAEIRYNGYANWINSDVTRAAIGTRGATFRSYNGTAGVLNHVQVPLVAEETHPGEEPQGLTITYRSSDKNAGFVLHGKNTYLGPTTITKYGRLEFAGEGAFPETSDVFLGAGRLMLTNAAHTVKNLTVGLETGVEQPLIGLVTGMPVRVTGAFAVNGTVLPRIHLYAAPYAPLAGEEVVGAYELLRVPVANKAALDRFASASAWANAGDGLYATFATATAGDEAVLTVTISASSALHPAAGGTETAASLGAIRDSETGLVRLGLGTLVYTGTGEVISGLVGSSGTAANSAAILQVENVLTLRDYTTQSGNLYKTGKGELKLMGTGTFVIGDHAQNYSATKPQGIDAEGNPPNNANQGFAIADGRVTIGVKDDAANAPHVIARYGLLIGTRTAARDSGKMETAGELVMNNGVLDTHYIAVGYYNGFPETTPEGGLHPKFILNGGTVNQFSENFTLNNDASGLITASPEFEMNGGAFNSSCSTYVGSSASTGAVDNVATFTLNAGSYTCYDFYVGNNANATKAVARFNGGDLSCRLLRHTGTAASTNKGCAEVHFNGTVIHPGLSRTKNTSYSFPSEGTEAKGRFNTAYVGKGGLILDFDVWNAIGKDAAVLNLRQQLLHDPDCEGEDGGLTLRNGGTVIFRDVAAGCTFTGPVVAENGSVIGLDGNWTDFRDESRRFFIRNGGGFRLSDQKGTISNVELGGEGDTALVTIELCTPNGEQVSGLIATKSIRVNAPVTISFHRNGGSSNTVGTWFGERDVLLYPASEDANVPLEKFVANPHLPTMKVTFTKSDITSGTYAGYKKITAKTERVYDAGTAWISTAAGGAWEEGANWEGDAPVNATNAVAIFREATGEGVGVTVGETAPTVGVIALNGDDAAKGYALTGGAINLHQEAWNEAGEVVAVSGSHTIATPLVTDNSHTATPSDAASVGGLTGAIGISALSNATLTVTGTVTPDAEYSVVVNPKTSGGGTTVLKGKIETGTGVTVRSGTFAFDDFALLNGKKLTIGPGTVHYTGPDAVTESPIGFNTGATNLTSVLRIDNRLTLYGAVTMDSTSGPVMKTGPGELVINSKGAIRLGGLGYNTDWNKWIVWPDNGDSAVMSSSAFCLDEGTLSFGREGQTLTFGSGSTDIFIGSQPRGWAYSTDKVTLNQYGGVMNIGYFGLGHGMRRGTDAAMSDLCYVEFNQYGGIVTNISLYMDYDATKGDSHIQSTMNLRGGRYVTREYVRLGQAYNKTGENTPSATVNIYAGATWEFTKKGTGDTSNKIFMPYVNNAGDKTGGYYGTGGPDATLNLEGGTLTNCYLIIVGQNGGRGEIHLNGGLLNCENIVHYPYSVVKSASSYYHVYDAKGTAHVSFNGGVFQPVGAMDAAKDTVKSLQWNASLSNFETAVVQGGGARISTAALKAERYTLAQGLTHDADLGEEPDGGLVKTGAGVLAMAAQSTYTGETQIREGTLLVTKEAPEGELLPNSVVRVSPGATLEFEQGAKATISRMAIDCAGEGMVTLKNIRGAKEGTLYLTNVSGTPTDGMVLPVAVEGKCRISKWTIYINGEKYTGALKAVVYDGRLVFGYPNGFIMVVR